MSYQYFICVWPGLFWGADEQTKKKKKTAEID